MKNTYPLMTSIEFAKQQAQAEHDTDDGAFLERIQAALKNDPISVTDKKVLPPSGSLNDYWSMGIYWWPDTTKPDGLPYIRRDGHVNPETRDSRFDSYRVRSVAQDCKTLLAAQLIMGGSLYVDKICEVLEVFFLDDATRMNPSLTYGQGIPGRCEGRGIGIIETTFFIDILDVIVILAKTETCPPRILDGMKKWFNAYLDWLLTSENGQAERAQHNNHGTWMDAQLIAYARFGGKTDLAKTIANGATQRIDSQIDPDGRQPHELTRTRSFTYSVYNLNAFISLAMLAKPLGISLWEHRGPHGQSIRGARDFLEPFANGTKTWAYTQIDEKTGEENPGFGRNAKKAFDLIVKRSETLSL